MQAGAGRGDDLDVVVQHPLHLVRTDPTGMHQKQVGPQHAEPRETLNLRQPKLGFAGLKSFLGEAGMSLDPGAVVVGQLLHA